MRWVVQVFDFHFAVAARRPAASDHSMGPGSRVSVELKASPQDAAVLQLCMSIDFFHEPERLCILLGHFVAQACVEVWAFAGMRDASVSQSPQHA